MQGDAPDPITEPRRARRRAVVILASLAIHGALLVLALAIPSSTVAEEPPPSATVSVIDIDVPSPREPLPPQRQLLAAVSRPGTPGTAVRAHDTQAAGLRGRRGRSATPLVTAPPAADPFSELSIKYDGVDLHDPRPGGGTADEGIGPGAGQLGPGRGLGLDGPLGLGTGGSLRVPPVPPSQARPPRPKYPYHRWPFRAPSELGGSKLLLELSIDARGEVTAVRLLHGVDRRVDGRAIETARRFEFYPALDDAGRPTAGLHRWEFVLEGEVDVRAGLGR
jgi:hypothetical protein